MSNAAGKAPPPLRVNVFAVANFRSIGRRIAFELNDDVTVFHGDTGSGKSTALAAMDLFFRALSLVLQPQRAPGPPFSSPWGWKHTTFGLQHELLEERDIPDVTAPVVLAATFEHDPSTWVEVQISVAGNAYSVDLQWNRQNNASKRELLQRLYPFGSTSRPLAVLDARRRPLWSAERSGESLLAPALAKELYALRTSKVPSDRERWRSFASELAGFPTLRGATVSIEAGDPPELSVEFPGRIVLGLDDLSSGEQELAALMAGLLLGRAAIVAVEEPEMGLDAATQQLWREICAKQREAGLVHQLIIESHAVTFDSPHVVRFHRDADGYTKAERALSTASAPQADQARQTGAKEVFVTREGYTKLPDQMARELGVAESGARMWFLRGAKRWEAWPEAELEDMLAEKSK